MNLSILKWTAVCAVCMAELVTEFQNDPTNLNPDGRGGANPNATVGPYAGQFGTWNQLPWYLNQGLQTDIGLNDAQLYQLNAAYQKSYMQYQLNLNGIGANLPSDQLVNRQQQIYHGFLHDFDNRTEKILIDPAVRRRYNELSLQYQGYRAFNHPRVRRELKLTPEQIKALNKLNADFNTHWNRWNGQYATHRDSVSQQFNEALEQRQQNLNEVLTPEQREAWKQMTGSPYDFKAEDYFVDPSKSQQQ